MQRHRKVWPARRWASPLWRSGVLWEPLWILAVIPMMVMAADEPRSPSRLVPARGLVFYLEYDGLAAHPDAWKATAACEILRQKSAGEMIADVARQVFDRLLKIAPNHPMTGDDLVRLEEHIVQYGFAIACHDEKGRTSTTIMLNHGRGNDIVARVDRLFRFALQMKGDAKRAAPAPVRGRELHRLGLADPEIAAAAPASPAGLAAFLATQGMPDALKTPVTWWLEGETLILVVGPSFDLLEIMTKPQETRKEVGARHQARVDAMISTLERKEANASTHPAYALASAEGREIGGFEANGLFFAESRSGEGVLGGLRERLEIAAGVGEGQGSEFSLVESLGLTQPTRIVGRWGFRGKALLTDVRFLYPADARPTAGAVGLLDRAGFSRDRLPPIPQEMGTLAFGSLRPDGDVQGAIEPLRRLLKPELADRRAAVEQVIRESIGPQLGAELLRHLGPTWGVYASPGGRDGRSGPTVPTVLASVDNADAFDKVLDRVASRINDYFRKQTNGGPDGRPDAPDPPALAFERLPAPARGYRLVSPAGVVPWLTDEMHPTILIGRSFVAMAANPGLARRAIAAETQTDACWRPTGELVKLFECLPERLSFLRVGNPRDSAWPEAIAHLPDTAGPFLASFVGVGLGEAESGPPSDLLTRLGVSTTTGLRARVNRENVPTADEIRAHIFPSILAATVDDHSLRLISLEALPWGCVGLEAKYGAGPGAGRPLTLGITYGPSR